MYKHKRKDLYITKDQYNKLSYFYKMMYEPYEVEEHELYFKGEDHKFHKIGKRGLEWHI